jgi:hypothetical protein
MVYNPATDFLALWRNIAGVVSKVEMPGLDYVVAALARAGVITLSVSATAPVVSQSTTAWLQTAVPSNSAEGVLFLWNAVTSAYVPATAALFLDLLEASAGQSGVSWWTSVGGPPLNTVGNNGDFAVRTDEPNGIYGPKALGVWPASPLPGTADVLTSSALDNTFGATEGELVYRGPLLWQGLGIGAAGTVLTPSGGVPAWEALSALLDAVFGNVQGDILYRDTAAWKTLAPGVAGTVLTTGGAGADPSWLSSPSTFPSGTVMLFQQTAAPVGWTKQTAFNDYGLRVVSGAVGSTPGTAFSTVFAQTSVGNTALNASQIPAHTHPVSALQFNTTDNGTIAAIGYYSNSGGAGGVVTDNNTGGGGAHNHSVSLALSYVDMILASKN